MQSIGLTSNVHRCHRKDHGRFRRRRCALVAAGLLSALVLVALGQPLHADPVYIGPSGPTHSWASAWFEESHTHSPGTFDEMQLQIDTANSPGATFEIGSTEFSPGWSVSYNTSSELVAGCSTPGGANSLLFDLVFNNTPPSFVGIYFQLFNGNQAVENGYFYRGTPSSPIPGSQSVGGGWSFSYAEELPPMLFTDPPSPVPEPSAPIALLGLLAAGLAAGGWHWRSRRRGLPAT